MATRTEDQDQSSTVAVFSDHVAAENAIKRLRDARFDIKSLSIIGRDFYIEGNVVGFYKTGDRIRYWGNLSAFWGGLWGSLAGAALFIIPGVGPVLIAGPITTWVIGALEGAVYIGGLSTLGAGLVSLGIPRDKVLKYESSVKAGMFLLVWHGRDEDAKRAKATLEETEADEIAVHELPPEPVHAA